MPNTEIRVTGTGEQQVMDAVAALLAAGGGTLIFPKGRYTFHHLRLDCDNVTLRGEGNDTILATTYLHTDGVQAIRLIGDNLTVRDLAVVAANPLLEARAGFHDYELLRIGGDRGRFCAGATVDNVTFTKGGGCNAYRTRDVQLTNSRYKGSHGNSFGSVDNQADVIIENNTATDGNDDLVAVTCDANVPGGTLRVEVRGNTLARTDAKAVCTTGVDGATIEGNYCADTYAPAVQVFQDTHFGLEPSRRVTLRGNTITRGGTWFGADRMHAAPHPAPHGAQIAGRDIRVESNTITGSHGRGVQADGVHRFHVTGNTVIGAGGEGINVGSADLNAPDRNTDGEITGNTVADTATGMSLGSATRLEVAWNNISAFGGAGETRGIYYGHVTDSRIHHNTVTDTGGGTYPMRVRPGSTNPGTQVWGNATRTTR